NRLAVKIRGRTDGVDGAENGLEFSVQSLRLVWIDGRVRRLSGQCDSAVQQGSYLRERAIGGLQHADAVRSIELRLRQRSNVGLQAVGDRQAGCVVGAGVDPQAGRQLSQCLLQGGLRVGQRILRRQGGDVI